MKSLSDILKLFLTDSQMNSAVIFLVAKMKGMLHLLFLNRSFEIGMVKSYEIIINTTKFHGNRMNSDVVEILRNKMYYFFCDTLYMNPSDWLTNVVEMIGPMYLEKYPLQG